MQIHSSVIQAKLVGYEFKQDDFQFNSRVIREREDKEISNDTFIKSNQYEGKDALGRRLDLTSIINRQDGYLEGTLSDAADVDYYRFDVSEYRNLSFASEKYNLDITVTLDNIPEGCDYDLILYDENGAQVGIGKDNGNGGKSLVVPNWNFDNKLYTIKVQAKNGSDVNGDSAYHLSFQTKQADGVNGAYQQRIEMQEITGSLRRKLHEGQDASEEKQALDKIRKKYEEYYREQVNVLHGEQAKEFLPEGAELDREQLEALLSKMAQGTELTEDEQGLITIYAGANDVGVACAKARVENFLQKATNGKVTLADISVENGRIVGLPDVLDKLLNQPGDNLLYRDYREDILAIKEYEMFFGKGFEW